MTRNSMSTVCDKRWVYSIDSETARYIIIILIFFMKTTEWCKGIFVHFRWNGTIILKYLQNQLRLSKSL